MTADIRFGDHITVSIAAAAVIVDTFTVTEKLLYLHNGQRLSPKVLAIRDELRTCLNSAANSAHANRKGPVAESVLDFCKSPREAAEHLGIREGSVRAACNAGHLGRKISGRWLISDAEIETYRITVSRRSA
jgi:hypothetical protein